MAKKAKPARLTNDGTLAQAILATIFEGGCVQVCEGKCDCRDVIPAWLAIARMQGRQAAASEARLMAATQRAERPRDA